MATIPIQVGHAINEKFILVDAANAAVTGKVQGDFTIKISNGSTGNIATTGLTITEVSAVNDPGHYAVAVVGTTGFQATNTGEYTVEIYLTTDLGSRVAMTFLVTSNGDFDGTMGAASFTATAANGRITDGAAALSGATVRVRTAAGLIYTSLTSDASGLWGPVYFDAAGTYTLDVQKSGYAASSASTITVVSTTATLSPATDIAILVATTGTGLTASDLWAYARRMARNKTGSQADTEIKQSVNDALDMLAMDAEWPWLLTDRGTFSLDAAYSTGTIAMTTGLTTVTLTTGTWPTWAASGKLFYLGKIYFIASRTSGSVINLSTAWKEASVAAGSFKIFRNEYSLASDLMKFGMLHPGQTWAWGGTPVGHEHLLMIENDTTIPLKYPACWSVANGKIKVWPYPSDDVQLNYSYYRKPANLVLSNDEADWAPTQLVLLRRAIDYQIALRYEDSVPGDPSKCLAHYHDQLTKSKPNNQNPMLLPSLADGGMGRGRRRVSPGDFILPANV